MGAYGFESRPRHKETPAKRPHSSEAALAVSAMTGAAFSSPVPIRAHSGPLTSLAIDSPRPEVAPATTFPYTSRERAVSVGAGRGRGCGGGGESRQEHAIASAGKGLCRGRCLRAGRMSGRGLWTTRVPRRCGRGSSVSGRRRAPIRWRVCEVGGGVGVGAWAARAGVATLGPRRRFVQTSSGRSVSTITRMSLRERPGLERSARMVRAGVGPTTRASRANPHC